MGTEGMRAEIDSAVADDQAVAASRPFAVSRWLSAAVRAARPRQWLKNLLVFAAFYRPAGLRHIQWTLAAGMVATYVTWAAGQATGPRYWHVASALPLTLALVRFGMLTGRRTVRPVEDILTRDALLLACEAAWLALFTAALC